MVSRFLFDFRFVTKNDSETFLQQFHLSVNVWKKFSYHSPLTYLCLWESIWTNSSRTVYIAAGSRPVAVIFTTGNIRLPFFVTVVRKLLRLSNYYKCNEHKPIISLVKFWKRHQSSRSSRFTIKFLSISKLLLWFDKLVWFEVASAFIFIILWSMERFESSKFDVRLILDSIDDKI